MATTSVRAKYFDWLYDLVCPRDKVQYRTVPTYRRLFRHLYETDFEWSESYPMDENRAEDGRMLRYRFDKQYGYSTGGAAIELNDKPCSVLEMMIALAIRCEEQFMWNPSYGDRTAQWFWKMLVSLGLEKYNDDKYKNGAEANITFVLNAFLNRCYYQNGRGGLFTIDRYSGNMRSLDIWSQMCAYLNTLDEIKYDYA